MSSSNDPIEIVVCYGTSCFARGNSENLGILKSFMEKSGINTSLRMTGKLCQGKCIQGPNLMIRGKLHHNVTASKLRELLQQLGTSSRVDHGTA